MLNQLNGQSKTMRRAGTRPKPCPTVLLNAVTESCEVRPRANLKGDDDRKGGSLPQPARANGTPRTVTLHFYESLNGRAIMGY